MLLFSCALSRCNHQPAADDDEDEVCEQMQHIYDSLGVHHCGADLDYDDKSKKAMQMNNMPFLEYVDDGRG